MNPRSAGQAAGPSDNRWVVLAIICMALFIIMLDVSVVTVALPSIKESLGASQAAVSWVLNAYTLVFASSLILAGRLADVKGRKRVFMAGLTVFLVGSLLCALAHTIEFLIAWRVLQALGAALIMPVSLSLVTVAFPPQQRGMAIGIWGATSGISSAAGPAVGGLLCDTLSWQSIFYLNVPFVLVALFLTVRYLQESVSDHGHAIDWLGGALSIAMLFCLALGLTLVSATNAFTWKSAALFVAAALLLAGFIGYERRGPRYPLLDLSLFKERVFTLGVTNGFLLMFGMMAVFYVLPLYFQLNLGATPMAAGAALIPMTAIMLVVTPLCGRLADKSVPKWLMLGGSVLAAVCVAIIAWMVLRQSTGLMWLPLVGAGVGMALLQTPLSAAVMSAIPHGKEGAGSGVLTTFRQVGALFGVAALTVIIGSSESITPHAAWLSLLIVAVGYALAAVLTALMPAEKNADIARRRHNG